MTTVDRVSRRADRRPGRSLFDRVKTHGRTGNLSARSGDRILVTPTGVSLGALSADELSVIDLQGRHVDGAKPSKEAFLHAAVYRSRPEAQGVVHLHSHPCGRRVLPGRRRPG